MDGFSSRPHVAPPAPEDLVARRVVLQAANPYIESAIQRALANESITTLEITGRNRYVGLSLTVIDAQLIIECLRENPRFYTLHFNFDCYPLRDNAAALNVFRDGLPLCTAITTVKFDHIELGNEGLERLRPAFYNTSVTSLQFSVYNIQGQHNGDALRDLLVGNDTLRELNLSQNYRIGPEVAIGIKQGLTVNDRLQILNLYDCRIGNEGLANLLPADGINNNSLLHLDLSSNGIHGADGGRQVALLLQCFPALKVVKLARNGNLGPLGARALAPGLATAIHLESLDLAGCGLGNDGVESLILPDGQVNKSLTNLDLSWYNYIAGAEGGRNVSLLLQCFPTLKVLHLNNNNNLGPLGAHALAPGLASAIHLEMLDLNHCALGNDGVASLILADGQVNRPSTHLDLSWNDIEGEDGGRQVSLLLQGFPALKVLNLHGNHLGPLGARALAPGLAAAASHLEELELRYCHLGNEGVANLIPEGQVNRSLTNLSLYRNGVQGANGGGQVFGRQVSLLLQRCPALKILCIGRNNLGPRGARALAPGLATASHLESLDLTRCELGNSGVGNLVPDGQVNWSLTNLNIRDNNILGHLGGEKVVALVSRCMNLDRIDVSDNRMTSSGDQGLSPDQQRRLDMLFDQNRNRLYTKAQALGGSTFPVLFHFVEEAHRHEHGLSAIFVILQNDGDDYFCTALNRAME